MLTRPSFKKYILLLKVCYYVIVCMLNNLDNLLAGFFFLIKGNKKIATLKKAYANIFVDKV